MGKRGPGAKPKARLKARASNSPVPCWKKRGLTRSGRVINFIEALEITSGAHAGRPFKLRPWQKKIIRGWYATDKKGKRIAREGLLTMGRKNGKSALIAALSLAHLLGPEAESRGQILAAAADRDQSGIIFDELVAWIERNEDYEARCNIKRHEKVIVDEITGSVFRAMSSDAKKAHGFSPSFVIFDELAQWGDGVGSRLYDALVTATGARAEPFTVTISTQADRDEAKMSELVDYGKRILGGEINDPGFVPFVFETNPESDIWDEQNWYDANPALGDFRSLDEMRRFAERAKEIPSQEAIFRNLYLNQRVDAVERWISGLIWDKLEAHFEPSDLDGQRCFGGLDLGSTRDLTSFALYFPDGGELLSWSWCPEDNLRARELEDRVPYSVWRKNGFIEATQGRAVDKRIVALRIAEICSDYDVQAIAFDRWGMKDLERILVEEGITLPLKEHGQGFKDMGPSTASFEAAALNSKIKHSRNPVLTWALSNVALDRDPAGNGKPNKQRSRERIDPIVAAVMAVGFAAREPGPKTYDFSKELVLSI